MKSGVRSYRSTFGIVRDLLDVLDHWSPLGAPLHDDGILLFDGPRILERPLRAHAEAKLVLRLQNVDARTLLTRLLREQRPLVADIGHGSIADLSPELEKLLDAFGLPTNPETATRLIRALPHFVRRALADPPDEVLGERRAETLAVLRDAFLVAELAWAIGSAASSSQDRDVVAAAIEAAASIAGVLLQAADMGTALDADPQSLGEELLVRMHLARMEWVKILLHFDEYADLVAGGGHLLNVRLARLVGRVPERTSWSGGFFHLFVADPLPRVADHLRSLACNVDEKEDPEERDRLASLAMKIAAEERQRFLDVGARLLLPRYLIDHAVGMLRSLATDDYRVLDSEHVLTDIRNRARRVAWPLVAAALSGVLMLSVALALLVLGFSEWRGVGLLPAPEALPDAVSLFMRWTFFALGLAWVVSVLCVLWKGDRAASYSLLLRVPAATGFGLAILLALSFDWIDRQMGLGRLGPIVAIAASAVYAWIEFINQGGARRESRNTVSSRAKGGKELGGEVTRLSGRPLIDLPVLALGISTSVSAIVLEVFGRALLTQVGGYSQLRSDPFVYLETLAILASISLAIGTFLQAIWDEQPITAPLSYLRLRG